MVICCVPSCGINSWHCDPTVTFHDFPATPDLSLTWIRQINIAASKGALNADKNWLPRENSMICSKHFLQTDFKDCDVDALKPFAIPTIFGHKFIGINNKDETTFDGIRKPMIVKVNRPETECPNSSKRKEEVQNLKNSCEPLIKRMRSISAFTSIAKSPGKSSTPVTTSLEHNAKNKVSHLNMTAKPTVTATPKILTSSKNDTDNHSKINNSVKTIRVGIRSPSNTATSVSRAPTTLRTNVNNHSSHQIRRRPSSKTINTINNLIEIGPNTFLKINPNVVKVNKQQTPSGNTVLQFVMDQKQAANEPDYLPKLIKTINASRKDTLNKNDSTKQFTKPVAKDDKLEDISNLEQKNNPSNNSEKASLTTENCEIPGKESVVLGHLVDTKQLNEFNIHIESVSSLAEDPKISKQENNIERQTEKQIENSEDQDESVLEKADSEVVAAAPVLLATSMPINQNFVVKSNPHSNLLQARRRQVQRLLQKVETLTNKIEELENHCIVQEKQLSYTFIKKLKTIRKSASKGDPRATYILEQIRGFGISSSGKMRWSDSTLSQCAVWCRKAPYAYEYFKKADFFKLPCLGTVKRFIKKHPEVKFTNKKTSINPDDSESSSDFTFDEDEEEENKKGHSEEDERTNDDQPESTDPVITQPANDEQALKTISKFVKDTVSEYAKVAECSKQTVSSEYSTDPNCSRTAITAEQNVDGSSAITDGSNLEMQEIILPSGEIVQCFSSNTTTDGCDQYLIIPNVGEHSVDGIGEYSVLQSADSLPVLLQNLEHGSLQQDQLIFITNSNEHIECSETEVTTA